MSKRGSAEFAVLLVVLVVAVIAMYIALSEPKHPTIAVGTVEAPTGNFVAPVAKEYGGAVRGIAAPGTRAFPSGRALEQPKQDCYTCSCLTDGITAEERASAEKACADNCGGAITQVVAGACR